MIPATTQRLYRLIASRNSSIKQPSSQKRLSPVEWTNVLNTIYNKQHLHKGQSGWHNYNVGIHMYRKYPKLVRLVALAYTSCAATSFFKW